ncbi:EamA family transporter [Aeromicrobium sp. Sec7.5]
MEAKWVAVTAVAPLAWGATYVVTRQLLPEDAPLWGAAIRAMPAGLLLLILARRLPRGSWWWRSLLLGTVNIGAFFLLVYVAAQALPSSVAASIMALAPLVLTGFAWWLLDQRPTARTVAGAVGGIAGVVLLIGGARGELSAAGVVASASALLLSAFGSVLPPAGPTARRCWPRLPGSSSPEARSSRSQQLRSRAPRLRWSPQPSPATPSPRSSRQPWPSSAGLRACNGSEPARWV